VGGGVLSCGLSGSQSLDLVILNLESELTLGAEPSGKHGQTVGDLDQAMARPLLRLYGPLLQT
jgi:hypothetical protein